ncbi:MAG TPA: type IV secretory system conjugative DNA transfer family protein [Gemmataceae bacterium]|nr:type IV secretory system conjugative DNA transfer family protein [Gemmataceae bacterium]
MYLLSRLMLTLAVALFAYCAVLATILAIREFFPESQGLVGIIVTASVMAVLARRKVRRIFSAMGTAAWASNRELERAGMLNAGKGLILGRIPSEGTPLGQAIKALLHTRLGARDACRAFFDHLKRRKRKQGRLVRLPQAVHTMVVAPTGVGKGVSCIIPFLLTCEESCVVVDFKGENALLTAERRRRMGQQIVILDPFKVVTQ